MPPSLLAEPTERTSIEEETFTAFVLQHQKQSGAGVVALVVLSALATSLASVIALVAWLL